jgi:hypothetical protein
MILVVGTVVYNCSIIIMSLTELRMQPTIHLESKGGHRRGKYSALPSQCIVRCIFKSVGLIITLEIPYTYTYHTYHFLKIYCFTYQLSWNIEPSKSKKKTQICSVMSWYYLNTARSIKDLITMMIYLTNYNFSEVL